MKRVKKNLSALKRLVGRVLAARGFHASQGDFACWSPPFLRIIGIQPSRFSKGLTFIRASLLYLNAAPPQGHTRKKDDFDISLLVYEPFDSGTAWALVMDGSEIDEATWERELSEGFEVVMKKFDELSSIDDVVRRDGKDEGLVVFQRFRDKLASSSGAG